MSLQILPVAGLGATVIGISTTCPFVLASASSRRKELLASAGVAFQVVPPPIAEPVDELHLASPAQQAEALAFFKARTVSEMCPGSWVLAADTLVALEGRILGKAANEADARDMLQQLSGSRHAVITGVALLSPAGERLIASEATYVTMRKMSDAEIDEYIGSGEWVDKAGAYAIQETADRFVEGIDGSFTNVVGLPMELVGQMLKRVGHAAESEQPPEHRTG